MHSIFKVLIVVNSLERQMVQFNREFAIVKDNTEISLASYNLVPNNNCLLNLANSIKRFTWINFCG